MQYRRIQSGDEVHVFDPMGKHVLYTMIRQYEEWCKAGYHPIHTPSRLIDARFAEETQDRLIAEGGGCRRMKYTQLYIGKVFELAPDLSIPGVVHVKVYAAPGDRDLLDSFAISEDTAITMVRIIKQLGGTEV